MSTRKARKQVRQEARRKKEARQFFTVAIVATVVFLGLLFFLFQGS